MIFRSRASIFTIYFIYLPTDFRLVASLFEIFFQGYLEFISNVAQCLINIPRFLCVFHCFRLAVRRR